MSEKMGRRDAARRALTVIGAVAVAPSALIACGGEDGSDLSCSDNSGLQANQINMRQQQHYVDSSPNPEQHCNNCNFWREPTSQGGCGTCSVLLNSPVHPQGHCNLWAAAS